MDRTEQAEFAATLMALAEVYDAEISPTRAEMYFLALEPHTLAEVQSAIGHAVRTCTFFPKPAELVIILEGSADDHAEVAWVRWLDMTAIGAYVSPDFSDDPALAQTLATMFGSWADACRMEKDEEGYRHAEFRRLYLAMRKRDPHSMPSRLVGIHEASNRAIGYLQLHDHATPMLREGLREQAVLIAGGSETENLIQSRARETHSASNDG